MFRKINNFNIYFVIYLSQIGEYFVYGFVVQIFRVVDDDDIYFKGFFKIFDGFCFVCFGGIFGVFFAVQVEGSGQGDVIAVSEGGDDQTI